ncbi:MAG: NYN domain-containing protein [Coriobacteriia bacterium]|nr:NYN domain-containing protein [Coriobacteriia bacterium]
MRFVVDGYNVAMSDPATAGLSAEDQRAALLRRLAARGAGLLGAGPVTVVFDGRSDGRDVVPGGVQVRFSGDRAADDVVHELAGPTVTVVTSDRELAARCEARGARVLPASALFEAVRARRSSKGRYPASAAGLPKGANRITEELKRVWLADEEGED